VKARTSEIDGDLNWASCDYARFSSLTISVKEPICTGRSSKRQTIRGIILSQLVCGSGKVESHEFDFSRSEDSDCCSRSGSRRSGRCRFIFHF